jgi:hypothetical protein
MYLDDDGDRLMKPSNRPTTSRVSRLRRRARRFDQNGADTAALALGRRFASDVLLDSSSEVYF